MADQRPSSTQNTSDEIDLGALFQMIRNGFNAFFRSLLRLFLYIKNNILKLLGLIVLGVGIALIMNYLKPKEHKIDVIVKPNFESKDYLFDAVSEIQSNIKTQDTAFFKKIGIDVRPIKNMQVEIAPIEGQEEEEDEDLEVDLKYLQVLKDFSNDIFIQDILKSEILKKSVVNYRITFSYKGVTNASEYAAKIMDYINNSNYFNGLKKVYNENARRSIEENRVLIDQIDELIAGFSKRMSRTDTFTEGTVVLDNEKGLDVPTLLSLKNRLLKEIELKNLEVQQQKEVIRIINFGNEQTAQRKFYNERVVKFPLILIGLFLFISMLMYLNKKSSAI